MVRISESNLALNETETERLTQLEAVVKRGLAQFYAVGDALREIRESRLYREEYESFEAYCADKWQMTASRARQLIGAANVIDEIESVTTVTPTRERQTRALAQLPKGERAGAWDEVVSEAGPEPTTAQVESVVAKRRQRDTVRETESAAGSEAGTKSDCGDPKPSAIAGRQSFNRMLVALRDALEQLKQAAGERPAQVYKEQLRIVADDCAEVLAEVMVVLGTEA